MPVSRLIAAKPPPPSASQTPEIRFVRYQNRYQGWAACHGFLKHIPHALAHLIAAKPTQEQPNAGRQQGFAAIKRAGFGMRAGPGRQVGWKIRTPILIAVLIAYKPLSDPHFLTPWTRFVRYQMCDFCWGWGPPRPRMIAELIAAKPGLKRLRRLGAEGFRSYQM